MTSDSEPLPGQLLGAVWLLRAEAAGLAVLALFLVYETLTVTATDLVNALFVTGFAAIGAAVLWALAVALGRRRSGARAPAMVLQLMLLPIGYYMLQGGLGWLGGPLIALGLLVCGLLLSPPTNRALGFGVERNRPSA
ncbi:hypothetical protein [Plantactinospora sp. B5E13]|uniref:hypothetical protein n=1 Tax=unclassified Plantactinospora TaxID=2631981 RepID=UPI00325D35BB